MAIVTLLYGTCVQASSLEKCAAGGISKNKEDSELERLKKDVANRNDQIKKMLASDPQLLGYFHDSKDRTTT